MWFRTLFIILVAIAVLFSCSNSNPEHNQSGQQVSSEKNKLEAGKVISKVVCKADSMQSYSLYLPSGYSSKKTYPVVYMFDPHASGVVPVSQYKELAEKYNYMIVGSNNSKNGTSWEQSQVIAATLFADVSIRLPVDVQRVYLLGFSGGARVANTLTITNGGINSVICCGAASPLAAGNNPRSNYCFLGIVGNEDFNYIEMKRYDRVDLAGHNVKHSLISFNGKHEWPEQKIMDEAFWWLELNAMRRDSTKKDQAQIAEHFNPLMKTLEMYYSNNKIAETYFLAGKIINFYNGLADLSKCYEIFKTLQNNKEVDAALKAEERVWKDEENLKKEYINAFQTKNLKWWENDIAVLKQKIKTGKDTHRVLVYKRVLAFLSLVAYMQTSNALKQNAIQAAEHFGEIYVLIDPENSEPHYLRASIAIIKGDTKKANLALEEAVKKGFADIERLQNDTLFNTLRSSAGSDSNFSRAVRDFMQAKQ